MKVVNIHHRTINQPKVKISPYLDTLSTNKDAIWPEKWPRMKFKDGLKEGAKGGHGPIRYVIEQYIEGDFIRFRFSKPKGFNGFHQFEIKELETGKTEIKHTIEMNATGSGIISWLLAIRWLHDALIEDALDKIENLFLSKKKVTEWNWWVRFLRKSGSNFLRHTK